MINKMSRTVKMPEGIDYAELEKDIVMQKPELKTVATDVPESRLKIIQRGISKTGLETLEGAISASQVEQHISIWLNKGFRLAYVKYVGETPEFIQLLFVLVKD